MMTNGPAAKIGEVLDINLDRPRDRLALAEQAEYNHYRAEVVRFLHERHKNPSISEQDEKKITKPGDTKEEELSQPTLYAVNE